MKKYKCKYCKDKGYIQIAPNVRGIKECPYCQETVLKGYQPYISEFGNPPKGSNNKDA